MMSTIGEEYEAFWREKPKALGKYLNDKYSTANPNDGESNVETDSSRSNNGSSNSTNGSSKKERRSK